MEWYPLSVSSSARNLPPGAQPEKNTAAADGRDVVVVE